MYTRLYGGVEQTVSAIYSTFTRLLRRSLILKSNHIPTSYSLPLSKQPNIMKFSGFIVPVAVASAASAAAIPNIQGALSDLHSTLGIIDDLVIAEPPAPPGGEVNSRSIGVNGRTIGVNGRSIVVNGLTKSVYPFIELTNT